MEKEELIEIIIKDIIKLPYEVQEKLIEKYEVNRNEKDSWFFLFCGMCDFWRDCEVLKMDYAKIMKFLTSKGEEQEKALDELNQKEVEFVLDRARAALARRQAAKNGGACNDW